MHRAVICSELWKSSFMSYFSTPFSNTRSVFFSINQITNLFLQLIVFLRAMSMCTNGKRLFFIVWNGRVGVDDLHVYSYQMYFQVKTK